MVIKRVFDIVVSFLGLVILIPVYIILSLLIKFLMPGPVLFFQERIGRHGKPFDIYKFRTMFVNQGGNAVSVKGDNRITPFGASLRKYKLDELPELLNVLKGDMSLVGPRPDVTGYADKLVGEERQILELRPGITGPASIKYVNEEEILASVPEPKKYNDEVLWKDKVKINLEYYRNQSFIGDIMIILKTITRIKSD